MNHSDWRRSMAFKWPKRVRNGTASVIQPYSVVRITSTSAVDGEIVYTVGLPNTTFLSEYLVLGPMALGTGSSDEALATSLTEGGLVQYTGSTPTIGWEYGPTNGSAVLTRYRYGFRIIGTATTLGSLSVVPARQFEVVEFLCKSNETITEDGDTGAISVYDGNQADTSIDISGAVNRTGVEFANGNWGKGMILGGTVFVEPWQCP